jgi:hypothetical protein
MGLCTLPHISGWAMALIPFDSFPKYTSSFIFDSFSQNIVFGYIKGAIKKG